MVSKIPPEPLPATEPPSRVPNLLRQQLPGENTVRVPFPLQPLELGQPRRAAVAALDRTDAVHALVVDHVRLVLAGAHGREGFLLALEDPVVRGWGGIPRKAVPAASQVIRELSRWTVWTFAVHNRRRKAP